MSASMYNGMHAGHSDGRVAHWSLSPEGDTIAMYEHSWPAHSLGKVSGLAVTPWGELWSCSTSGSVRAWSTPASAHATGGRPYARLFECKRARVAAAGSRLSGGKPHGNARVLAVSATGRVVWSAGKSGLVIWNAYSGDFLGSVEPSQPWTPLEPDSDDMLRINSDMVRPWFLGVMAVVGSTRMAAWCVPGVPASS